MKSILIVLEYATYMPIFVGGIIITYILYAHKGQYQRFFYVLTMTFPLFVTIATVKNLLILGIGSNEKVFLIPNILFVALFISSLFYVQKDFTTTKINKILKYLLLPLSLLLIGSFLTFNLTKGLDLFFYGAAGIIVFGIPFISFSITSARKIHKILLFFAGIAIATDIMLKFFYYIGKLNLAFAMPVSLSLRMLGAFFVLVILILLSKEIGKVELIKEVQAQHRKMMNYTIIISIFITIVIQIVAFNSYTNVTSFSDAGKENILTEIGMQNTRIYSDFTHLMDNHIKGPIEFFAQEDEIKNSKTRADAIKRFCFSYPIFATVTFIDNQGIISYTYPFESYTGKDISSQLHVKEFLQTRKELLTEPFQAVQGFPAMGIYVPVFENGNFLGGLAGLVDLRTILSYSMYYKNPDVKEIIVFNGTIATTDFDNNIILKEFNRIFPDTTLKKYFYKSSSFIYMGQQFQIIGLEDTEIYLSGVNAYAKSQIITGLLLVGILIFILYLIELILVNTDRNFGFALENAINEEKAQLRKTEDVQLKLSQLNAFLYTITFRETEEEFFSKLLELSIMLIPNGEKGSIWVKKGKFYSPIVGKGYDENLLKQLKLSETAAIDRWQNKWKGANTHIELNIASQGSLPEEIEISKVTSSEIKTTLFGAIKVDNKYYGSIFIDNTQSKNAFNEDDIEIMLGISKLASFYMTTKKLLEDLIGEQKRTLDVTNRLRALVDFSAHITPLESEEQFYKKLLNISLNIMPHAQKGSILIKEEGQGLMKYIAAEGYNLSQLNKLDIPFQLEESITESGNALVLKNITHKDVTISEKSKEILQSEELDKIKSTITAPTFIGDVYQGGIFLDNLDAEDIFDNEDLEVIKAVSNIASLYARTRYLLKESENRSILNKIAVEAFHEIDSAKSREEAIANTFYTFRKFFPKEIECISIIFKVANEFEYYYGDSTKVRYGTLTKLPECTKEINKSGFTEHIDRGCEALSFAPDSVKAIYVASPAKDSIFAYGFKDRELKEEEKRLLENLSFELSSALENFELVQLREETFVGTFIAFAKAIDSKDPYTRRHSEEVTVLSYLIGRQIGLGKEDLRVLFYASILHDIGKIGIPDAILQKPSSLTKEEYDLIKTHPVVGAEIAGSIEFLENAAKVLKYHHERYDGKGYPDKLSKEEIPFLSRIISVADSFSAITSERTYRPKRNYEEAVKILIEEKGKQFDPAVVDAFLSIDKELVKRELQSLELLRIYRNITS